MGRKPFAVAGMVLACVVQFGCGCRNCGNNRSADGTPAGGNWPQSASLSGQANVGRPNGARADMAVGAAMNNGQPGSIQAAGSVTTPPNPNWGGGSLSAGASYSGTTSPSYPSATAGNPVSGDPYGSSRMTAGSAPTTSSANPYAGTSTPWNSASSRPADTAATPAAGGYSQPAYGGYGAMPSSQPVRPAAPAFSTDSTAAGATTPASGTTTSGSGPYYNPKN